MLKDNVELKKEALMAAYPLQAAECKRIILETIASGKDIDIFMLCKLNDHDIRYRYRMDRKILGHFPPQSRLVELSVTYLLFDKLEAMAKGGTVIEKPTFRIGGAIAMPPVLESDKLAMMGNDGLEMVENNIEEEPEDITEPFLREKPKLPITLDMIVAPLSAPIARKMVSAIMPSVANNVLTPGKILDAPLPREEKQFGILTKPEGHKRVKVPSIKPEKDPFKPPAKGSNHSPMTMKEHEPGSGRYEVIPPRDSDIIPREIPLAVIVTKPRKR
jgi:hypothetical protein